MADWKKVVSGEYQQGKKETATTRAAYLKKLATLQAQAEMQERYPEVETPTTKLTDKQRLAEALHRIDLQRQGYPGTEAARADSVTAGVEYPALLPGQLKHIKTEEQIRHEEAFAAKKTEAFRKKREKEEKETRARQEKVEKKEKARENEIFKLTQQMQEIEENVFELLQPYVDPESGQVKWNEIPASVHVVIDRQEQAKKVTRKRLQALHAKEEKAPVTQPAIRRDPLGLFE